MKLKDAINNGSFVELNKMKEILKIIKKHKIRLSIAHTPKVFKINP